MKTRISNLFVLIVSLALMSSASGALAQGPSPTLQGEGGKVAPQQQAQNVELVGQIGGADLRRRGSGPVRLHRRRPAPGHPGHRDPAHPVFVGQTDVLPGFVQGVAVAGSYAYVADCDSGLRIINVANPAAPTEVGFYDTPGNAPRRGGGGELRLRRRSLAAACASSTSPTRPPRREVGFYDTPGCAGGVAVAGSYAYVADGAAACASSTSPTRPRRPRSASTTRRGMPAAWRWRAATPTSPTGSSGLRIIDVANPAAPTEVGFYDTPGYA